MSSIGKEEDEAEAEEHGNSVKVEITCITPVLPGFLDLFQILLAFNMFKIEITCITPVLPGFLDLFQILLLFNMFSTLVLV